MHVLYTLLRTEICGKTNTCMQAKNDKWHYHTHTDFNIYNLTIQDPKCHTFHREKLTKNKLAS